MRVTNRHVIYVQGYDPRGLAQYYRMFRTELRKFDALYGVTSTIGRPKHLSEGEIASWSIETKANDWQTRTTYDFLRFEDFIQRDMALPIWRIVTHTIWIYLRLIVHGTVFRFMAANWRFLIFITWPHLVFWFEVACLALIASFVRRGLDALGIARPVRLARDDCAVHGRAVGAAEDHGEIHLSALSDVRHHLDLGVLAQRAPRMGRAARPLRTASLRGRAQQRRAGDRAGRPQFRLVPRHRDSRARPRTRPRARPARPAHRAADARRQLLRSSAITRPQNSSATICG